MNRYDEEEYRHEVTAWTVGRLRAALAAISCEFPSGIYLRPSAMSPSPRTRSRALRGQEA